MSMCMDALQAAIGGYIQHSMQAIDTPWGVTKFSAHTKKQTAFDLCDAEEMLVPYYAVHSKQVSVL